MMSDSIWLQAGAVVLAVVAVFLAGRLWQRHVRKRVLRAGRPRFTNGATVPDEAHFRRLELLMGERAMFRDPDLDPVSLGSALGLSRRQVRELVREYAGGSVQSYVNGYRVREARQMLEGSADKRPPLKTLARRVGFRSRVALYRAFRSQMGCSPSAWAARKGR